MTTVVQDWTLRVLFNDSWVSTLGARISHGVTQQKAIATIDMMATQAAALTANMTVTIEAALNGAYLPVLFTGIYRPYDDRNCSVSGRLATVTCEGPNYRLEYGLDGDLVFTGGAKETPQTLQTAAMHIGNDTIAWYADTTPNGTSVDITKTLSADSSFIWIAGRLHGTNSYPTSFEDRTIKNWSRIEVWQGSTKKGYANLPVHAEQFTSELDYTNDANWTNFEVMIAGDFNVADGDLIFRFISGIKPGSGLRDEYEIKSATYQVAGKNAVRDIIRGLKSRSGFALGSYQVPVIKDLAGSTMELGGYGPADAGQVRIVTGEKPGSFIARVAELFGYYDFDCPDGITRTVPIRGTPTGTVAATFTEGTNLFSVRRSTNPQDVFNAVEVSGWSGVNQNRVRVEFSSTTDPGDVEPSAVIPTPPGVSLLSLSDALLTSNALCADVRQIAEINHAESAVMIEWETWPHALRPGQVVTVNAPSIPFAGNLFLMSNEPDLHLGGFRARMVGWAGAAVPFDGDADADPNPSETPIEPDTPRPDDEFVAYRPSGGLNDG